MRTDGCDYSFGEYGEEKIGGVRKVENWNEIKKEQDDYWEYRSEKI